MVPMSRNPGADCVPRHLRVDAMLYFKAPWIHNDTAQSSFLFQHELLSPFIILYLGKTVILEPDVTKISHLLKAHEKCLEVLTCKHVNSSAVYIWQLRKVNQWDISSCLIVVVKFLKYL